MSRILIALTLLQATFSTETVVVPIAVTVIDNHGRSVPGLTKQDFQVYEDGRLKPIATFLSGEGPLTVGLVVDYSLSMRPKMPVIIQAIEDFARASRPEDQLFLVSFNDSISVDQPGGGAFVKDPGQLPAMLSNGRPVGPTALYDGVIEAIGHLKLGKWDRKALVIVSDGGDNASQHTAAQVIESARQSNALLYAICMSDPGDNRRDAKMLERLAQDSGGASYSPDSASAAGYALRQIVSDLRQQYTLGLSVAGNKPGIRKIEVKVQPPSQGKLRVRARSSYMTPGSSQAGSRPEASQ